MGLTSSGNLWWEYFYSDSQTMGVIMPAILDLLYVEYCRARLAEARRQPLIAGKSPEV